MRVERLNGYISLYRDLGLEEEDSNYHSGDAMDDYEEDAEALSNDEVNMDVSLKHVLRVQGAQVQGDHGGRAPGLG